METPVVKRSTALAPPREARANVARPVATEAGKKAARARVYRSLTLRPDEWMEIVAKGRRK